jgi:outer membrane protein TolC
MIAGLLLAASIVAGDSVPRLTLAEALTRAAGLDPGYVRALGNVTSAQWARRSAISILVAPAITVSSDYTAFSRPQFNIGIGELASTIVSARADARFELFAGGRKVSELSRTAAELEGARATELQARFLSALVTEFDFYAVLGGQELLDVARDRLRRAEEQLVIARARVVSGAVVQTDSLQLLLELTQARVALLREEAGVLVARLRLGRRVGIPGPVDAVPVDTAMPPPLPLDLREAVALGAEQGPEYRIALANERAADAAVAGRKGSYFPQLNVAANLSSFDDRFFPNNLTRSSLTFSLSFPVWDGFQRELNLARARAARDVARAIREDVLRATEADVTQAYLAHHTARNTVLLAWQSVAVARENFRVQEARYRAGASTILDLLEAQTRLTEAQAQLVQSRYATRLALAGLEAVLGRRLFETKE